VTVSGTDPGTERACIRLLGGLEIGIGEQRVALGDSGRRDPLRLAGYLALCPGRRAHRDQVIDSLWPDVGLDGVANRLHKARPLPPRADRQARLRDTGG
jgi:DNA-binding SARP family transcriptional activator